MRPMRALLALLIAVLPVAAFGQSSMLYGGSMTAGHPPIAAQSGSGQPLFYDAGPAGGNTTGQGASEFNITARGNACNTVAAPVVCAGQGTGQLGTIFQIQDAVSTNAGGYHALSFSANDGTGGLLAYNAFGSAPAMPLRFNVNGVTYPFPFPGTGTVTGPSTSIINDVACWNNTLGTLLKDCGPSTFNPGGSSGQIQFNNAGVFGGFTLGGDGTLNTGTGALTISKIGGQNISLAGSLTTGAAFTTSGANALTLTTTTTTNVTMPASGTGTLATLAGTEALTNKTYNGNTLTAGTGTLTIAAGKTLTASNTLTFTGTDFSTLNIGTGGTLGTNAFTSTAYIQGTSPGVAQACVAWTGGGTTIVRSFTNGTSVISSITRAGTGNYTINGTFPTNGIWMVSPQLTGGSQGVVWVVSASTSATQIESTSSGSPGDMNGYYACVF